MFPVTEDEMVLNPFQVGAMRIVIAGMALLPLAIRHIKKLRGKKVWFFFLSGLAGNLIPSMMFPLAETNVSSSLAGLLNTTTSFFVVIIGILIYKKKPTFTQLLGMAIAVTGLYFVLNNQYGMETGKNILYALFIFPATICYAISLTTIKFKLNEFRSTTITSLSFFLILAPALIIAISTGSFEQILYHKDGIKALGYLSILAIVGTAIAVLLFTWLVGITNHIFSSAVSYMLPVVAIILGTFDGEAFYWANYFLVFIILGGVILMNRPNLFKRNQKVPS